MRDTEYLCYRVLFRFLFVNNVFFDYFTLFLKDGNSIIY